VSDVVPPSPEGGVAGGAPARRLWRRALGWVLALSGLAMALSFCAALVATWLALRSEMGALRVLAWVPGLTVEEPRGQFLGDFQAQRLEWRLPRGGHLVLLEPRWQGLQLAWSDTAPWHVAVSMRSLQAQAADLIWVADHKPSPLVAPADLTLPVALQIHALSLARLSTNLWSGPPITGLAMQLALQQGPAKAARHRVTWQGLQWQGWLAEGALEAQSSGAMGIKGRLGIKHAQGQGSLDLGGTLAAPAVSGWMSMKPPVGASAVAVQAGESVKAGTAAAASAGLPSGQSQADQRLDLIAQFRPFEPWPVQSAQVKAQGLNLQRILPTLPRTGLSGHLEVAPRDALPGAPGTRLAPGGRAQATLQQASDLQLQVDLRNELPGLWNAASVPLSAAKGSVTLPAQANLQGVGQLGRRGLLELALVLPGQDGRPRGDLALSGAWDLDHHEQTRLNAQLNGVDLRALDSRSPPLQLQGQVAVKGQAAPSAGAPGLPVWLIDGALDGLVPRNAQGVPPSMVGQVAKAKFKGSGSAQQWQISQLDLISGAAQAKASGSWQLLPAGGAQAWQGTAKAALQAFDPALWMPWPRPPGDASQRTRLDGTLQSTLRGPADMAAWWQNVQNNWQALASPGRAALALATDTPVGAVQGTLAGELKDSLLLGAPLSAQWQLHTEAGWQARLDLASGINTFKLDATLPLQPNGRWSAAQVHAAAQLPDLRAWQAWAKPLGWSELAGNVVGEADMRLAPGGAWGGKGQLKAEGFKAVQAGGVLMAQTLQANWQTVGGDAAGGRADQALSGVSLDAQIKQARWGTWQMPQGRLLVQGPRGDHTINLQAEAILPPRKQAGGETLVERIHLDMQARAALSGQGDAMAWAAKVQSLQVRPEAKGAQPWLSVEPFELAWQPLPKVSDHTPHQWRISPTRASVFGAWLTVRQGQWRQGPQGADTSVEIALEPLKLAEVLARWQPAVGWGGDLLVAGQAKFHQGPDGHWLVDAGLARQSGDLTLREPGINGVTEQTLGIRAAKLSLLAQNGVWRLSEQIDARVLGVLQGEQRLSTVSPAELPRLSDALSGQLSFKLDNLRTASVWAPAGWRLGGKAGADLQITGTLGAPGMLGRMTGQDLAISNPLLGVQINRGDLLVLFRDRDMVIDHFSAEAGEGGGRLDATGRAAITPEDTLYELQLKATRFGLLNRVDRKAVVSGDLAVQVTRSQLKADGQMRVDSGLVDISQADAPTVGDDVNVINRPGVVDEDAAAAPGRKLAINLGLDLGQQLRLKGRGLDTRLAGQVRLTTPNGRTHVQGTLQAIDGTYAAYGQRLQIERGSIAFTGSLDNPRLDIQAMRPQSPTAAASDVRVGVLINGTAQDPRVRLYSEPAMTETEKLSWLVLGRAPAGLNGADIGLLQTAAYALLDGEGPSVHDNLIKTLGLDELSVRQTDGAVRDTIVAVGKQVSSKWYVGYERSLNATAGTWQAIYRLAQRFTLRVQSGDDNAIDLIWSKRWGD
jgi:translocation and assembly module TamB